MFRLRALALALPLALVPPVPAGAVPGGKLDTLELGKWYCELPGDATALPTPEPGESFTAVPDSSYIAADGTKGSYLRLGNEVSMTSGAKRGERFRLQSDATMHKLDREGKETDLRCVRAGDPAANFVNVPGSTTPKR